MKKLFFAFFIVASCLAQQRLEMTQTEKKFPLEFFAVSFFDGGEFSRVDLYFSIPNKNLIFRKIFVDGEPGGRFIFRGVYELTIGISKKRDDDKKIFEEARVYHSDVLTYEETQSLQNVQILKRELFMRPGWYKCSIAFEDSMTRDLNLATFFFSVKRYVDVDVSIHQVSEIVWFERVLHRDTLSGRVDYLVPIFPGASVSQKSKILNFYFEVYHCEPDSLLTIRYDIETELGKVVVSDSFLVQATRSIMPQEIAVPIDKLIGNKFNLKIFVFHKRNIVITEKKFEILYSESFKDLDEAIQQLKYITSSQNIKKMLEAPPLKKDSLFQAYWKSRDPSPATPENELMEEYYLKIANANKYFTVHQKKNDGWKSDRGMVYVIFGLYDDIQRGDVQNSFSRYEMWEYYNVKGKMIKFLFVDKFGFGDYKLYYPLQYDRNYSPGIDELQKRLPQ